MLSLWNHVVVMKARAAAALRELVLEVFRLNGALLRHGAMLTVPVGQTQARWQVIGAVGERARTVPQIARQMGMTRQGVQRVVDLLAKDGLLAFERNPNHARSPLVRLTETGRQLATQLTQIGARWSESVSRGMGPVDLEQTVEVIRRVVDRLDETT